MSKTIINGIDVSECAYFNSTTYEEPYCNIDQERLYTCSSDENCYYKQLKRLQEENKSLQMLSCVNCGEKYLSPDGSELYEKNVQLQKENEELKKYQYTQEYLQSEIEKRQKALEEIREIVSGNYEILDPQAKQDIKKLIDEVLK